MVVTITSSDCPFVIWVEVQWMQCSQCSRTCTYFINTFFNITNTVIQVIDIIVDCTWCGIVDLSLQIICYGVQLATVYSICGVSGNFTSCYVVDLAFFTSFTNGYRAYRASACEATICMTSYSCVSYTCCRTSSGVST